MPNIPSSMGQIRARATCDRNGVTLSGQSDFFQVTTNGVVNVGDIKFGDSTPIPVGLEFEIDTPIQIENVQDKPRLKVFAKFADGSSSVDISEFASGINFNSSNENIVTISGGGVITAFNSGVALITVRYEGAIAIKRIVVLLSGDADGDGLPDDFEIANGLDPNDPIDAFEDADSDGLSNLEEFQAGTDLNNADTDGDGISDSEELISGEDGFITNPLLADSDGDGVNDNLEITAGSDPTDANSIDLTNILDSLSVGTPDIILTYNTLNNEVSRQLAVTGQLIDGSTIDLTDRSTGTNYSSSDLTVLSFGINDGEIFGGAAGVATLTVSNSGFTTEAYVTVVTFSPTPLGYLQLPDDAVRVENVPGVAYVASDATGLVVVDISNPAFPYEITRINTPGRAADVRAVGDYLYVADLEGGLHIFDISSPNSPSLIATVPLSEANDVSVSNGVAYVSNAAGGIAVIDVSAPSAPVLMTSISGISPISVHTDGNALVALDNSLLYVYDMTDPLAPVLAGSVQTSSNQNREVIVRDGSAFVAAYTDGFRVIDITDSANMVNTVGDNPFYPLDVAVIDDHAFFADIFFVSALPYVNVADPANAVYQGFIDFSRYGDYDPVGLSLDSFYTYIIGRTRNAARLYVAQHSIIEDTAGIAPEVEIEKPLAADSAISSVANDFEVNATDDVAVASVRFSVDGNVIGVRSERPYRVAYTPPAGATEVTLSAVAFDIGGNQSSAVEITIPVIELEVGPGQLLLTVESIAASGTLSKLTQLVDYIDMDTQLKAANLARDLALAGWGIDGSASQFTPPTWSATAPNLFTEGAKGDALQIPLSSAAISRGSFRELVFHTDETMTAGSNDICEQANNFGYIAGVIREVARACVDPQWGIFYADDVSGIAPEIVFDNADPNLVMQGGVEYVFDIQASDDVAIAGVYMLVDGVIVDEISSAPYTLYYTPPFNVGPVVNVEFIAVDFGGRVARTGNVVFAARADTDQDGLTDDDELAIHQTDPNVADSDGDGLLDGEEVNTHGTDPLVADTDGDGLVDGLEVLIGTSPNDAADNDFSPFITDLVLSDTRVVRNFDGISAVDFEINASVEISNGGQTWLLDVSNQAEYGTTYGLNKTTVVTHNGNGGFSVIGIGFDRISVESYGLVRTSDVVILDADSVIYEDTTASFASNETLPGLALFNSSVEGAGYDLVIDGNLVVIGGTSSMNFNSITVNGDVLIDGADFTLGLTGKLTASGSIDVINGASVLPLASDLATKSIYSLDIESSGAVFIDETSMIDATGKGFPNGNWSGPDFLELTRGACHGGWAGGVSSVDCSYGRYELARFAGSGGDGFSGQAAGGGVISLKATSLKLEGELLADGEVGGTNGNGFIRKGAAGGAIHIDVEVLFGTGSVNVRGGDTRFPYNQGGGGGRISIYVDDQDGFTGTLNSSGGYTGATGGGAVGGAGTVFIKENAELYGHLIVNNAGLIAKSGSTPIRSVGRHTIASATQVQAGVWQLEVAGTPWKPSDPTLGWGIDGIEVDLDASDATGTLYTIVSNTENTVTINTLEDLSGVVSNELIGVHTFESVQSLGGASISFGQDRLVLNSAPTATNDITGEILHEGELVLDSLSLSVGQQLRIDSDRVRILGDVLVDGENAELNFGVDSAITIGGNVTLSNGGVLSSRLAYTPGRAIYPLDLEVAGNVFIDVTSKIDASGRGYRSNNNNGPDYIGGSRAGCHGGIVGSKTEDCTYGRYEQAMFAGSAGYYRDAASSGNGGGLIRLTTPNLVLDGSILADGLSGGRSALGFYTAGAGGSIHVDVDQLSGAGAMSANGGSVIFTSHGDINDAPAGGRISVYVGDRTGFNGTMSVRSGPNGTVGGSGTIYVKEDAQTHGHLIADNGGRIATPGSTPIRSVGRHTIASATQVQAGVWQLEVAGTPWKPSDPTLGWGIDGIEVDLDASDATGTLYTIVSNTENTVTINTLEDLSGVVSNELIGVQTFESVQSLGGASISFGQDRLVLNTVPTATNDITGEILHEGELVLDSLSLSVGEQLRIDSDRVRVLGDVLVDGENAELNFGVDSTIIIGGNMTLSNGGVISSRDAYTAGKKVYPLDINVTGNVFVDSQSKIDASGRGYRSNNNNGPDYIGTTRAGCHGGIVGSKTEDCTYGRYEQASFAGSAGYYLDAGRPGHGGGIVRLSAPNVVLDGSILADGASGARSAIGFYTAGAGGSIHLDVGQLSGQGAMSANGGSVIFTSHSDINDAPAGGRISVYVGDRSGFAGSMSVRSGPNGTVGGSGTIYVKEDAQSHGHLTADNGGRVATPGSTPIRSVGRHTITSATQVQAGVWQLEVAGTPWKPSDPTLGWGIDGIEVDLDASDATGSLYTIVSNTENAITINTLEDLSGVVNNELVGVHTFESVQSLGGASISFGQDRLVLNNAPTATNDITGEILHEGELVLDSISLSVGQQLRIDSDRVRIIGDVLVDGENAELNFGVNSAITIGGNVTLSNGGVLSSRLAYTLGRAIYPLDLEVAGNVFIDVTSKIDASGQGYRSNNNNGPDYIGTSRAGCHGGIVGSKTEDCTYGRYEQAMFAGSSGYYRDAASSGNGGGLIRLTTPNLVLDGSILADGLSGGRSAYGFYTAGAGGSIHLDVDQLSGQGAMSANGGSIQFVSSNNDDNDAPSGGRISVYVGDRTGFNGTMSVRSGPNGTVGGSGTIYVKEDAQTHGHLIADNGGRIATPGSTPIRSVGRHTITSATQVEAGVWQLEVAGTPWTPTDLALGWGIDGIEVDLDASEDLSPLYVIEANSENAITINTLNDLSGLVGGELVGTRTLQTIQELNGASLSFGEDKVFTIE